MKLDTMLRNEMLHIAGQTYVHVEIGDYSLSLIPLPELVSPCLFISFASQRPLKLFLPPFLSSSRALLCQSFSHYVQLFSRIFKH